MCSLAKSAFDTSTLSSRPRWPGMGSHQAFRWRTRKQGCECVNHLLLDDALRQHHLFIAFDFNNKFIVHLQHELRLPGYRCAQPRINADQSLNGDFRRGTLNG